MKTYVKVSMFGLMCLTSGMSSAGIWDGVKTIGKGLADVASQTKDAVVEVSTAAVNSVQKNVEDLRLSNGADDKASAVNTCVASDGIPDKAAKPDGSKESQPQSEKQRAAAMAISYLSGEFNSRMTDLMAKDVSQSRYRNSSQHFYTYVKPRKFLTDWQTVNVNEHPGMPLLVRNEFPVPSSESEVRRWIDVLNEGLERERQHWNARETANVVRPTANRERRDRNQTVVSRTIVHDDAEPAAKEMRVRQSSANPTEKSEVVKLPESGAAESETVEKVSAESSAGKVMKFIDEVLMPHVAKNKELYKRHRQAFDDTLWSEGLRPKRYGNNQQPQVTPWEQFKERSGVWAWEGDHVSTLVMNFPFLHPQPNVYHGVCLARIAIKSQKLETLGRLTDETIIEPPYDSAKIDEWIADAKTWMAKNDVMVEKCMLAKGCGLRQVASIHNELSKDGQAAYEPFNVYKGIKFGSSVPDVYEILEAACSDGADSRGRFRWLLEGEGLNCPKDKGREVEDYIDGKVLHAQVKGHSLEFVFGSPSDDAGSFLVSAVIAFRAAGAQPEESVIVEKYAKQTRAKVKKERKELGWNWTQSDDCWFWKRLAQHCCEGKNKNLRVAADIKKLGKNIVSVRYQDLSTIDINGVHVVVSAENGMTSRIEMQDAVVVKYLRQQKERLEAAERDCKAKSETAARLKAKADAVAF